MSWIVTAADVAPSDSQPIIVALISALGGVLVAVVTGLVAVARRESEDRRPTEQIPSLGERTAVLERRADDNDEQLDLQDRRLDRGERRLERLERYALDRDPDYWRKK